MQESPSTAPGAVTRTGSHPFVVAPFVRLLYRTGYVEALPVGEAHAKTYGTTRTLCGVEASSWHRLWDQPFPAASGEPCPRCLDRLEQGGVGVRRHLDKER